MTRATFAATRSPASRSRVDDLGAYIPSAWADDGVVEALEEPAAAFCIGVQWHPEVGEDPRSFEALVGAARGVSPVRASR